MRGMNELTNPAYEFAWGVMSKVFIVHIARLPLHDGFSHVCHCMMVSVMCAIACWFQSCVPLPVGFSHVCHWSLSCFANSACYIAWGVICLEVW